VRINRGKTEKRGDASSIKGMIVSGMFAIPLTFIPLSLCSFE
jgi:hypothetical protein